MPTNPYQARFGQIFFYNQSLVTSGAEYGDGNDCCENDDNGDGDGDIVVEIMIVASQESLGVSRISLSVTTMDDVFLKIGEMIEAKVSFAL